MAYNAAVLKQTLSFKSLRLLEGKDVDTDYKSFSDSELMVKSTSRTRSEQMRVKWKSESNLNISTENLLVSNSSKNVLVDDERNVEKKVNFSKDKPKGSNTESETKLSNKKENQTNNAVQSSATKNALSRRMNLMSVTSILQGMLNIPDDYHKNKTLPSKREYAKDKNDNKTPQMSKNAATGTKNKEDDIILGFSNPNALLEGPKAGGISGENFIAEPRCLTLKKYNSSTDPFLTDDSLIFEPDFEDEIGPLEEKQAHGGKQNQELNDTSKDMFFDDDEISLNKKYSTIDREEGELSPELHSATSCIEEFNPSDPNVVLNAEFLNRINECLRDIDKKCRELHSSSAPKYSIKPLQRILSNVDNIKRKLSFLINSKNPSNEHKAKSSSNSRNRPKDGYEHISKLDGDNQSHSFSKSGTRDNESNKNAQSPSEDKGTIHSSKNDENSQRIRHDSKDRHSRHRSSRDKPSQTELFNRKKISILEKLGTKQEIERIQSLFKRQMNLITQHVIQKNEGDRIHTFRKRESERRRRRHSSHKQSGNSPKNTHEKIDLCNLKTLEDMEAFLNSLKNKASDKVLAEKYITDDKMKGSLKFTSKKEKRVSEVESVSSKEKVSKTTTPQFSGTGYFKQPHNKDDSILLLANEEKAKTSKQSMLEEKRNDNRTKETTAYIAKTHTLWQDEEKVELTKTNPECDTSNSKSFNKNKVAKRKENETEVDLIEVRDVNKLNTDGNKIDSFNDEASHENSKEITEKQKNSKDFTTERTASDPAEKDFKKSKKSSHVEALDFPNIFERKGHEISKKKRKKEEDRLESESETESLKQNSKKKRIKTGDYTESEPLTEQEKQRPKKHKQEKYYSDSESVNGREKKYSNGNDNSKSELLIDKREKRPKQDRKKEERHYESESVIEHKKPRSKSNRKHEEVYSEQETMNDQEKQSSKKKRKEEEYCSRRDSELIHEAENQYSKRSKKKEVEYSDPESMAEEDKHIPKRQKPTKPVSSSGKPKPDASENEEQPHESKTRHASGGNLTVDANESLMRDLLSKKIYILGDEDLAALDSQFRIKVIGNEIYLKKVSNEGKRKRKTRSRRDSKLKSESENTERNLERQQNLNSHYKEAEEEPVDPEKVDATLREMEHFMQELRSKKKVSDDEQQALDITNPHIREEKFLARIQAKRKAKLMACVSAAPYSIEKEAKFLKALEKRDGELSDVESHKQKLMEKLRAETDAIVLAQKSGGKHSASNTDDDPLMDALLNVLKEAESENDENAKQVYVSFQLKKSDMKNLENMTEKPSHLSEESQKLLNNVRAKMRAKKVPASNISSLMLKPQE